MSEMHTLECPACSVANQPIAVVNRTEQYRCRGCGMVYYGPFGCDDTVDAPAEESPALDETWSMTTPPTDSE